ncbi:PLP-dependent transferase [Pseudoflavonifractor sp. AF19-9AC]|uniref:trans-sulfuration enzyme family protein n=1 Tax=Pseudoflavonifractor sp. AF19-9AC TaxID=2292244 RepID=UPI000E53AE6C|nr:PLP-dependent aspartate aminotransferase family protein [Pseudoflavonifractor sp. AF19-9AC]RHR05186.1 PLP-dependent transferase [Pseudoflavonifractor sp. AF19-9AC]
MEREELSHLAFETQIIHAGHSFDPTTNALASPIYQTATFGFETVEDMDAAWDKLGYLYTREGNPTLIALEEKLAALEGGEAAVTAASGIGAITSALYAILEKGGHLLCAKGLFFHSNILMNDFLSKLGVDVSFADFQDLEDVKRNLKPNTKLLFLETPTNPKLGVVDVRAVSALAKEHGCLLMVDSTFAPPPIQRALELGADLVVHSLTKYINGHGDALGGGVIGPKHLIEKIKYPSMPCFTGAALSPFNAWLIMRGMATLDLRVRRHCENALAIAKFLQSSPYVEKVIYPALPGDAGYELCQKQMNGLGGGIVAVWLKEEVKGLARRAADYKLCNNTKVITIATSLGEANTLIQVENDDMIRIAVGLENAADLIEDLRQALEAI